MVWTGQLLVVWGGLANSPNAQGPSPALSDGAAYDPATKTWSLLPRSPLAPRSGAAAVWDRSEVILWGGQPGATTAHRYFSDGAAFDPVTDKWQKLPPSPLPGTSDPTAMWTGQEMLVTVGGGATGAPFEAASYDPASNRWERLPAVPSVAKLARADVSTMGFAHPSHVTVMTAGVTAAWTGNDLLMWATYVVSAQGQGSAVSCSPGPCTAMGLVVQALSWAPGAHAWHPLASPQPGLPLLGAAAVWTGREVLFIGGTSCLPRSPACPLRPTSYKPGIPTYDPTSGAWSSVPGSPALDEPGPVLWASTGQALVGIDDTGHAAALAAGSKSWKKLAVYPYGDLDAATAAWTGMSLIVWGSDGAGPDYGAVLA